MNKSDLIDLIAAETQLSKKDAASALNAAFSGIINATAKGETVSLFGFGTFMLRERKARTGRNPQTGQTIQIAAANFPSFKPSLFFKREVND
ncbi:MAG: HU family DNA-binding protein [Zoogloeaceae bacterium]|nr:HU family DNA-binding protein [Gammaproteobacteria bacterium]MCP5231060.1 HU family DNA-binding protein [Zoogloeaceae bacterium]